MVKALCPCWNGHEVDSMLLEWNAEHAKPGAAIEDVDKRRRYNVEVKADKIEVFDQARAAMQRAEALHIPMLCVITTPRSVAHQYHAVALVACVPGDAGKMVALNSWGAQDTYMDITPANFRYAMSFDPVIVQVHLDQVPELPPPVREVYTARGQDERLRRERSTALRAQADAERRRREAAERETRRLQEEIAEMQREMDGLRARGPQPDAPAGVVPRRTNATNQAVPPRRAAAPDRAPRPEPIPRVGNLNLTRAELQTAIDVFEANHGKVEGLFPRECVPGTHIVDQKCELMPGVLEAWRG
jgi:hypothetical protein